jgi:hypothetical protein
MYIHRVTASRHCRRETRARIHVAANHDSYAKSRSMRAQGTTDWGEKLTAMTSCLAKYWLGPFPPHPNAHHIGASRYGRSRRAQGTKGLSQRRLVRMTTSVRVNPHTHYRLDRNFSVGGSIIVKFAWKWTPTFEGKVAGFMRAWSRRDLKHQI